MLLKEFLQASFFQSKFLRLSFVVINSNNVSSDISLLRLSYYIPKKSSYDQFYMSTNYTREC